MRDFYTFARGDNAQLAFDAARFKARWDFGRGGESGTVADKHTFIMMLCPVEKNHLEYAKELVAAQDHRIYSRWGPAGCFIVGRDEYLFFGVVN